MDQRVGVDHLHGHGGWGGGLPRFVPTTAARVSCPEHKRRTQPLAGSQQGIAHCIVETGRGIERKLEELFQQWIDGCSHALEFAVHESFATRIGTLATGGWYAIQHRNA